VRRLTTKLTGMSTAQTQQYPGNRPKRSEIVVAGAHVFAELMETFRSPRVHLLRAWLADGILDQMLAETGCQNNGSPGIRTGTLAGSAGHLQTLWR